MPRILVLHDDDLKSERLAALLSPHAAATCRRPHQALRRLRLQRFDLLWIALPLIGMEPLDFTRRMHRVRSGVPVIAISEVEFSNAIWRRCNALGTFIVLRRTPNRRLAQALTAAVLGLPPGC